MDTPQSERTERKLAAILAADVVGYSRLMGEDEEGTHLTLKAIWREVTGFSVAERRGRVVKTMGDGLLVEFASVVDAVLCAIEIQRTMTARNLDLPAERQILFRIGINIGDIIIDHNDIFGDGVNIAARLEGLAEPGGICISESVRDQVSGKLDVAFVDQGEQQLKNITRPIHAYRVRLAESGPQHLELASAGEAAPPEPPLPKPPPGREELPTGRSWFRSLLGGARPLRALSAASLLAVVLAAAVYAAIGMRSGDDTATRGAPAASPVRSDSSPGSGRPAATLAAAPATIGQPVFFERDNVALPRAADATIDQQAAFLRDHPEVTVTIETYCALGEGARFGTTALAALRANQFRNALKARGVAADRIAADPRCHAARPTPEAREQRAELVRN